MYKLNPLPAAIDPQLLKLLVQAEPAVIGHFRYTGFMCPGIRAHFQDRRVAGTAITIRVPGMDGAMVHYAVGQARPGDFIIIDRCGDMSIASLGGAVAYAARAAGVAGIVVDGLVTDLGELSAAVVWQLIPEMLSWPTKTAYLSCHQRTLNTQPAAR